MSRAPLRATVAAALLLPAHQAAAGDLAAKIWNAGSKDCEHSRDPPIEVFRHDEATFVLRQSLCSDFEAPFIYVLFGEHTVFVQDTGATADAGRFPLFDTVHGLVEDYQAARPGVTLALLVTHSHSHGDHTAGDAQFRGVPGVTLIEPTTEAVRTRFGFASWPDGVATIDLGGRELRVLPAPGHQDESVAVHDSRTGWLLTGDTLYPGRLVVRDWEPYRASIRRLAEFANAHRVSAVLGTHIEMSRAGKLFAGGNTHHPDEAALPLAAADLARLDAALHQAGAQPQEVRMDRFVVTPLSAFQRALGTMLRWLLGMPR